MSDPLYVDRMSGRVCKEPVNRGLYDLISLLKERGAVGRMLEVGTHIGVSTMIFAEAFADVLTVDPYPKEWKRNVFAASPEERLAKATQNLCWYGNVEMVRKPALSLLGDFDDGSFDFIYLDGDHELSAVSAELLLFSMKASRFIGGHDYCDKYPGVLRAVDSFRALLPNCEFFVFPDTSWLISLAR